MAEEREHVLTVIEGPENLPDIDAETVRVDDEESDPAVTGADHEQTRNPAADRYKEFSLRWSDPEPGVLSELMQSGEVIVLLQGALVAGLGLFLLCSPTSGIVSQIIGSLVFLTGIAIATL